MSIIGNASLNRVVKTLTNFDVYFNISAESTSNLVQYEIFLDDVSQGITSITPIKQTGLITVNTFASNIGYHTFGVLFTNSSGESEYFTQTIYLDHTTPILHKFELTHITRDVSDNFVLHFDVHASDETGISRLRLKNIYNGEYQDHFTEYSTNDFVGNISLTLTKFYSGSTRRIVLEYEDYSGNIGSSSGLNITLIGSSPVITNTFVKKVIKTTNFYEVTVQFEITQASSQRIEFVSLSLIDSNKDWKAISVAGSPATFEHTLYIPISEPPGQKIISASVLDNYQNSSTESIPFLLDIISPEGSIELRYAEKIGDNYYANVKFSAIDTGSVLGYGYQLDDSSSLVWKYTNAPSQFFETYETIPLGPYGSKKLYGQFSDTSGNLSPIYNIDLDIDTINPDCSFQFIEGEENSSGDFVAKFQLLASDNHKVQFIKLFGVSANSNTYIVSHSNSNTFIVSTANTANANTVGSNTTIITVNPFDDTTYSIVGLTANSYVLGHSDDWVGITETNLYNELRRIVIPKAQQEEKLKFYFQARDTYGNESPIRSTYVTFDKTKPTINVFELEDTLKTSTYKRVFMKTRATDNKGIVAYRKHLEDITFGDWISIEPTKSFNQSVYLDVPFTALGTTKHFNFQVKDVFGNLSNTVSFPLSLDEKGPTGNVSFVGAGLNQNNYVLDFHLNATDQGIGNVYFYSITADDYITRNWKPLANSAQTISEIVSYEYPRVNEGVHDFYFRFADVFKNESPVYSLQYDLDSVSIVGGIALNNIIKTPLTYYANVALYAVDNRRVDSYSLNGGPFVKIDPPVRDFQDNLILPLGTTSGIRTYNVKYKDGFDNVSNTYNLSFNLDNEAPTANLFANGVTSNATHYDLSMRLEIEDNQELERYKFWYSPNGEPNTWSSISRGKTNYDVNRTFSVPKSDVAPKFEWKLADYFQNESNSSEIRIIETAPPGPVTLSIFNVDYDVSETTVSVRYDVQAAANTTVDKLDVFVNKISPYVYLDHFTVDIPNQTNAIGIFNYSFAKNKTYGKFDVFAISDYGFAGPSSTITEGFDIVRPYANATFIGAFEDNYDYILQFRIEGYDLNSGLNYIKVQVTSFPTTKTFYFHVPYLNNIDDIFNVRIDQTHTSNHATAVIEIYDLMNNVSLPVTLNNIYLDRFRPAITNIVLNSNTKFSSNIVGINTQTVPISFVADDISYVTHYKYSKHANIAFDTTWTAVNGNTTHIAVTETVDMGDLGFEQGLQTFYVHAKDKFNNIGTSGTNFELDTIPPVVRLNFPNFMERYKFGANEFFKIPYTIDYIDNYSEVRAKYEKHSYGGNNYSEIKTSYGFKQSDISTDFYYILIGNHGTTEVSVALEDRLKNKSDFESFRVFLEVNPPIIYEGLINDGASHTTSKDLYVLLDMSDDVGVTEALFSTSNTETWDSPGWQPIPFAPRQNLVSKFTVDLDALGFVEGTCNVQMYVKDFCQNVTRFSNTIIYDKYAPTITNFFVNNITRSIDTFYIDVEGSAYDVVSGWNEFVISQSITDTNFIPVPGGPIIGNTPNTVYQTEYISVRDGGMKKLYFTAKDTAGNISQQANTEVYIDNELPVAVYFSSDNNGSKYYLTNSNNSFRYIVTDDYALAKTEFELENYSAIIVNVFSQNNHVTYDTQTFNVNLTSLTDGEHTIKLLVEDHYKNKISVPYKFYLDNTPPSIDKFQIKEIKPSFNGLDKNYDVEFDIKLSDDGGISHYELYDNDQLVTTVNVNNKLYEETPTIVSVIALTGGSSANTGNANTGNANTGNANTTNANTLNSNTVILTTQEHKYKIKVFDYATNNSESLLTKDLHDGSETNVNNFVVHGTTSYVTTIVANETFQADLTSPVDIKEYALTIEPTIDYDSAFWNNLAVSSNSVAFSVVESLDKFAISTLTGKTKIYLHVKDDCGNIANSHVDVFLTDTSPVISNVTSPITLTRQGKYYVGNIQFQVNDPDSLIEAYAVGLSVNPTNFKSILRTMVGTITHQVKIPEDQINGSEILYLQLRDVDGNLSNNYRISVRILDFKFEKFEIEMNRYIVGNDIMRVYFETESEPSEIEYGFQYDNDLEPVVWNTISVLNRNAVGTYYFDFNVLASALTDGEHEITVWLKNKQDEKVYKTFEFVSEATPVKPTATLNVYKTEYKNDKKYVWIEAVVYDAGVGVQSVSLTDTPIDNFENINIIQTKRIIKRFEYSKTNYTTIVYRCKLIDAAGTPSITFSTSVDLSNVY